MQAVMRRRNLVLRLETLAPCPTDTDHPMTVALEAAMREPR
jgi:hypothetical protein